MAHACRQLNHVTLIAYLVTGGSYIDNRRIPKTYTTPFIQTYMLMFSPLPEYEGCFISFKGCLWGCCIGKNEIKEMNFYEETRIDLVVY
jgi:hypothetical protein